VSRARRATVTVCLVVTSVLAPLAATATWVRVDLLHRPSFIHHVDTTLDDERVQREIANQIVARVTVASSRAGAADTAVLAQVTRTVLATDPLRAALRATVAHLHTQLVDGRPQLELDLQRPVDRLRQTLSVLDPRLAALLPDDRDLTPVVIATRDDARAFWIAVSLAQRLQLLLPLAVVGAGALALLLTRRRSHELTVAASGVAVACMVTLATLRNADARVRLHIGTSSGRDAFDAVWSAFASPLVRDLRIAAVLGLVVAGSAALVSARSRRRQLQAHDPVPQPTR
jgi:hypothetical protein